MSNSVWAFATVGFGAASNAVQMNTNNDYVSLQSDKLEEDRMLVDSEFLGPAGGMAE